MDKILEMRQERAGFANKVRALIDGAEKEKRDFTDEETKEYDNHMKEMETLKNRIEREEKQLGLEGELKASLNTPKKPEPNANPSNEEEKAEYKNAFFKAIAGKQLNDEDKSVINKFNNAMTEGSDPDGGFTVPEDISTKIGELKQTVDALEQYVTNEPVSTMSGARTLEVRADSVPFVDVAEMGTIGDMGSPKFQRMTYTIKKYAGFMPISNELLADTAENITAYVSNWIAKKSKATRNSLILGVLNGLTKKAFVDYGDIKTTLNVTLDPAISQNASIITNQDGYNYLDQLEDNDGRPLLQPDPTNATGKLLFGKPVVVLSNKTLASGVDKLPFIIGDLKEAIVLFDRKKLSVDMSKEGGDAWRTDSTELRAIEREDVKLRDDEAVVFGEISVAVA